METRAAIFGVGAPEAIVVAVVALLVFGPKGLAEATKGLGRALRSFQPTIRELREVSTELKTTLEQEIGIDEIRSEINAARSPVPLRNSTSSAKEASDAKEITTTAKELPVERYQVTEEMAQRIDPEIEEKRIRSAEAAWSSKVPEGSSEQGEGTLVQKNYLSGLTIAELEAEISRRKQQSSETGSDE